VLAAIKILLSYRELIAVLAWKRIALRYKQAYLGIAWVVLRPLMLVSVFMVVRAFVGIDTGGVPYPVLAYAALLPWTLFQESVSEGIGSVVNNAHLIRKIYFPREVFPLTVVTAKVVELLINLVILALLMTWYGIGASWMLLWVPFILFYTLLAALSVALAGAALNVFHRDVTSMLPVALSMLMYISPIIYPLRLVQEQLLQEQSAGSWSHALYTLYTLNPIVGIVDSFQRAVIQAAAPNFEALLPGLLLTLALLPFSYLYFKRAEDYFADVI
jgi:lipopolysaccharide transport system permease protein